MKHIIAFLAFTLSCSAFAQYGQRSSSYSYMGSYVHEFSTNVTTGSYTSQKASKDAETGTMLSVSGAYLHYLKDGFQVGAEGQFTNLNDDASPTRKSATIFDIVGLGVYNFQNDLKESFYGKAGLGLYSVINDDGDGYESKFGFMFAAGKRFPLFPSVTYTPEIRFVKKGDIDMGLEINFLNFGIYWN